MKKSVEIIGLPVISLSEGLELGTVKDFVINAQEGTVAALVVDDGHWYLGAKLLPFEAIAAVGEYAVTTDRSENLTGVTAKYQAMLEAGVTVIGTKVLTKAGQIQGQVTEMLIDEQGRIAACVIAANDSVISVPAAAIRTFGKSVLVIDDGTTPAAAGTVTAASTVQQTTAPFQPPVFATPTADNPADADNNAALKPYEEKHPKQLLGKKARRRIETDNGLLIVDKGGEITEEVLQKARLAGKFAELSMNVQW